MTFGHEATPQPPPETSLTEPFPAGYRLKQGTWKDKALLVKFLHHTYLETDPSASLDHLTGTVERYFSSEAPLWFAESEANPSLRAEAVACLWMGNAVDQIHGDRHLHVFLLYVVPNHRRQGIATALMRQAIAWAQNRGDRQIALQVYQDNESAQKLYQKLGFETRSLWMARPLNRDNKGS
ncbi:GNAT family N-acetyltransferase [Leptolyngbya sp. AN02str]|uniref:GNAT family N-acetyltransferase n=1 Tax=Leptolyngbya sp. AN02str TaxID=3423363 RepID=UPI003D3126E2